MTSTEDKARSRWYRVRLYPSGIVSGLMRGTWFDARDVVQAINGGLYDGVSRLVMDCHEARAEFVDEGAAHG